MTVWVTDKAGNKASVEFWGTEAAAEESLLTLSSCTSCTDCKNCAFCTNCTNCAFCADCKGNIEG